MVKPLENVSVYANYIEGLEAGTIVGTGFANTGEVLPPYQTKQHEMGVKIDWGRVITTVSAFDITKPIQLVDRATNTVTQSGETRNRGVEINAFGQVTEDFRVLGGVMFIDARQQKTNLGIYDGFRTFNIPGTQLNLGGEWDVPFLRGLTLTGRAIHTSEAFADQASKLTIPSWTRYDAGARYTFASPWNSKPVVVRFSVENLLDTNYWQAATNERYLILGRAKDLPRVNDVQLLAMVKPIAASTGVRSPATDRKGQWWVISLRLLVVIGGGYTGSSALVAGLARGLPLLGFARSEARRAGIDAGFCHLSAGPDLGLARRSLMRFVVELLLMTGIGLLLCGIYRGPEMEQDFRASMGWAHTWAGVVVGALLFAIFWMGTCRCSIARSIAGWRR